jgi:hypothetical protein
MTTNRRRQLRGEDSAWAATYDGFPRPGFSKVWQSLREGEGRWVQIHEVGGRDREGADLFVVKTAQTVGKKVRQKQVRDDTRMAIVEMADFPCDETHLVPISGAPFGHFKEMPGRGRQLGDYGSCEPVLYLTPFEAQA